MKKILVTLFIGLSSLVINAQEDVETILTSGKWFVESVQEKGQQPEMSADKNDEWIVYHKDGKAEENVFGDVSSSSWSYDNTKKLIKVTGAQTIFYKIIEVTSEKLIVELIEDMNSSDNVMVTYVK
ncbi:hypothetical protein [Tenacibaculum geojense]|uniref:Lipocalin-like domain-containing protein n=1 Tax=Tenacibaculum geojense TaxID=915352 RepID=A0ABW3JMI9_9FLAO